MAAVKTEAQYKQYFSGSFKGMVSIIDDVLTPIFGEFIPTTNPTSDDYVSQYGNGGANINHIYDYGTFSTDKVDISVFEVILADNCHISIARKNIQNTVRQITKTYSGAFIVFHYLDGSTNAEAQTWRLSWLKRLDVHRNDSPAKRYTYLCGPSYSCRTIAQRFDELQKNSNKTLDAITKAFDVEALSDEFFYNYRALYSKILGDGEKGKSKYTRYKKMADIPEQELGFCDFLERHKGDARYFGPEFSRWDEKTRRDYIKKLMGRLVFLQFLQKKGWMCGNPNYIKSLFEIYVTNKGENVTDTIPGSFLDEVLEPLFFGVLNTKVDDRKALFEKEGWNLKLLDEWKNIPYLNGGLFEQEEFDKPKSAFSNSIFNELFTLFSEYNFTIDENDPNDAEIGIDPEMLGKIFESQLEDNKDKGAFYTPKEIVQYMCKESLIAYLCTKIPGSDDDIRAFVEDYERIEVPERENVLFELKNVKICDPAIGSGAFPMGMLNLLVALREKLGDKTSRYEQKREIIQNNIFGVDIEKGAVDIARLRFWLSIVIDEETSNPHALPNLDYQIVKGNSLLHRFGLDTSFKDVFSDYNKQHGTKYTVADYKAWVADYLNTTDHNKKEEFRKKIEEIKSCFRSELTKKEVSEERKLKKKINDIETANLFGLDKRQKQQIAELKKLLKKLEQKHQDIVTNAVFKDAFEWRFEFPQLLDDNADFVGFDIVIGNPPYIGEKGHKELFDPIKTCSSLGKFYLGKMDYFYFFFHFALNNLCDKGVCALITTNYYPTSLGARKLRKDFSERANILQLINFNEYKIFESALGQHNLITVLEKCETHSVKCKVLNTSKKGFVRQGHVQYILDGTDESVKISNVEQTDLYEGEEKYIRMIVEEGTNYTHSSIFHKIINGNDTLGDIANVNAGIMGGCDRLTKQNLSYTSAENISMNDLQKDDGVFVLDQANKRDLARFEALSGKSYFQDFYKNSDIRKYCTICSTTKKIIFSSSTNTEEEKNEIKVSLAPFRTILEKIREINNEKLEDWYLIRRGATHPQIFNSPKIVAPQRSKLNTFGYNEVSWYASADVYFITDSKDGYRLKYILGLLNSKLYYLWLYNKGKRKGENLELYQKPLSEIPIKKGNDTQQLSIINLVDKILISKKADLQADTTDSERKIDILVYLLYGLTWDEVQIVENSL